MIKRILLILVLMFSCCWCNAWMFLALPWSSDADSALTNYSYLLTAQITLVVLVFILLLIRRRRRMKALTAYQTIYTLPPGWQPPPEVIYGNPPQEENS